MSKGFISGIVSGFMALGVLTQLAPSAGAAAIPYSLGGTWVCTFKNGDAVTIKARAGRQGVSVTKSDGDSYNTYISNTKDGGIRAHGDGWAWTLTPKDGAAELAFESTAKGETYTAPCATK